MEDKKDRLKRALSGADVVNINIINTHITDDKAGGVVIRLVSGIPENDDIIERLRKAL